MNIEKNQKWFELGDVIKRDFNENVWIPLWAQVKTFEGDYGRMNYWEEFQGVKTILAPLEKEAEFIAMDYNDLLIESGLPYADENTYKETGIFEKIDFENPEILENGTYLIIEQTIQSESKTLLHIHQDLIIALNLIPQENGIWIKPDEDYVEVLRITKNLDGNPVLVEIKNEFLKDYLCARKCGLFISTFTTRRLYSKELVVTKEWLDKNPTLKIKNGSWEAFVRRIDENGHAPGDKTLVSRMYRTDIDSNDDVPKFKDEPNDSNLASSSYTIEHNSKEFLFLHEGQVRKSEWITPGSNSPRVRKDKIISQTFFKINASGEFKRADELEETDGCLWFKPNIVHELFLRKSPFLKWVTEDTGVISIYNNIPLKFGVNKIGLINIFAEDIKFYPEYYRRLWSSYNVGPDGKVCKEFLDLYVKVEEISTYAPEVRLLKAAEHLDKLFLDKFKFKLFRETEYKDFFIKINRFNALSEDGVFDLANEINKFIIERIDTATLKKFLGLQETKLASIKSLENLLNKLEENGRELTSILIGVNKLRQKKTHLSSDDYSEALELSLITLQPPFINVGKQLIENVFSCLFNIIKVIHNIEIKFE